MGNKRLDTLCLETVDGQEMLVCARCDTPLCKSDENYRDKAKSYDLPIGTAEPEALAERSTGAYVLRHWCCPNCAVLIEVDMTRKEDEPIESFSVPG